MWISDNWRDYELLDCGNGERLERWGRYLLVRPDPQAIWRPEGKHPGWRKYDARYQRSSTGGGQWVKKELPQRWTLGYGPLTLNVKPMNFKHTGVFPEQAANWDFAMERIRSAGRPINVLNLFAYTGAASVACAAAGASVCHVDAAKGMVAWARENAKLSGLADAPIRWIVDDCAKFVERELRRGPALRRRHHGPPLLRPGALWGGLEARGEPLALCGAGRRGPLGRASLLPYQFLHHGTGPVGPHLHPGVRGDPAPRRPHRERRAGPERHRDRPGAALRRHRALGV